MKQYNKTLALGGVGGRRTPGIRKCGDNAGRLKKEGCMVLGVRGFGFKYPSYHLVLWPWASHFLSLDPSVLIFKMRLIKSTLPHRLAVQTHKKWIDKSFVKMSNNYHSIISLIFILPSREAQGLHKPGHRLWIGVELEAKCVTMSHQGLVAAGQRRHPEVVPRNQKQICKSDWAGGRPGSLGRPSLRSCSSAPRIDRLPSQTFAGRLCHSHFTGEKNEPLGGAGGKLMFQSQVTQSGLKPGDLIRFTAPLHPPPPANQLITTSHSYKSPWPWDWESGLCLVFSFPRALAASIRTAGTLMSKEQGLHHRSSSKQGLFPVSRPSNHYSRQKAILPSQKQSG